ncbi:hypothetical protein HKCCE2091_12200 [Rhodobacterales bacterium HKCCE2091]|nr:hypothetical protein [Rhodobacterales bacterium HKCCE2091]
MRYVSGFLRSESGAAAADTIVILALMCLFFSVAFALGTSQSARGLPGNGSRTVTIGDGWGLGGGVRLPQVGPLHDRR